MMGNPLVDPLVLRSIAGRAVPLLKALANEDRLLVLCQLSQGELCVSRMEELPGIHQPTLLQQLCVLRTDGVVATRREGKRIFYRLADAKLVEILAILTRLYAPRRKALSHRPERANPASITRLSSSPSTRTTLSARPMSPCAAPT